MQNSEALQQSYKDADGMSTDVNKLQQDIDTLVRSMGLNMPVSGEQGDGPDAEFDMDEFLDHLAKGTVDEHGTDGRS